MPDYGDVGVQPGDIIRKQIDTGVVKNEPPYLFRVNRVFRNSDGIIFLDCTDNSMPSNNSIFEYNEDIHMMPLSANPSITELVTGTLVEFIPPNPNACRNYYNLSYFKTAYVLSINKTAESVCLVDLSGNVSYYFDCDSTIVMITIRFPINTQ